MIGIYGGSFDPVHNGHLRVALEVTERLQLEQLYFVPCYQHALTKKLSATPTQRVAMLKLAIAHETRFAIDTQEIERQTVSYTIDTVKQYQQQFLQQALVLIIGIDALQKLSQWRQWQELLDYTNIVVLQRPGFQAELSPELENYVQQHVTKQPADLSARKQHFIYRLNMPLCEISSSYIRQQQRSGCNIQYLLPYTVFDYIQKHDIYCA